eukprot:EG_transcript_24343
MQTMKNHKKTAKTFGMPLRRIVFWIAKTYTSKSKSCFPDPSCTGRPSTSYFFEKLFTDPAAPTHHPLSNPLGALSKGKWGNGCRPDGRTFLPKPKSAKNAIFGTT